MKVTFQYRNEFGIQTLYLHNVVSLDFRLDETLDGGTVTAITDFAQPLPQMCQTRVKIEDGVDTQTHNFLAFDSVEKRSANSYVHNIVLCEPTRLAMGLPIDGLKVTQPVDGDKKTLKDVLNRLLRCATLERTIFEPIDNNLPIALSELLSSIISPEFHWETGTLLWECLCDIGNVINAIPRITLDFDNSCYYVTFDLVNEENGEYEL